MPSQLALPGKKLNSTTYYNFMCKTTKLNIFFIGKPCLLAISLAIALFINPVSGQSAATKKAKENLIELNIYNSNLNNVLTIIKSQSDYNFFYDREAAKKLPVNRLIFTKTPIHEVLRKMREILPLQYDVLNNEISVRIETPEQFNRRKMQEQPGKITGRVLDEKGETLPSANIRIVQLNRSLQSGTDGTYQLSVEPGTYTIEVSYIGYQTKQITGVVVRPGQNTPLNILLTMDSKALNTVVITSSYKKASVEGLYARQKNNAAVSDGITSEQISRTPDNNTAQVLKRISGLQVSDNKYVVIRGLSDRYNNVLLNGALLPSSEPNRRNFAFDMVPSAILDRIVVNKTATPDLTGEFTGGLVQIETKDIPDTSFYQVTIGTGFNTQSTGNNMYGLDRGKDAWIGFASDIHKKPEGMTFGEYNELESKVNHNTPAKDPIRQQMHQFLGSIPDNWKLKRYTADPIQNYQFQMGQVFSFKNNSRLGLVAALTYRNEQNIENRSLHSPFFDYTGTANSFVTTIGGSFNVGYQFGKNKITWQNTYNHRFSDNLWKYTGIDIDNSNLRQDSYSNVTIISQLFQSQLGGEHTLSKNGIKVDWFASAGRVDRDQPYSRLVSRNNGRANGDGNNLPADYLIIDLGDLRLRNGNLFYSELNEKIYNWAANIQAPFRLLNLGQTFKAGYQGKYRTADFDADLYRMYAFSDAGSFDGLAYDKILNQKNFATKLYLHSINTSGLEVPTARSSDGYDGFQRLNAFYGMLDLKPLKKLRIIGGLRAEKNDQNVHDFVFNPQTQHPERQLITNKQTDWLPSVNAIYSITDKLNFRAAWYKSVARPDLRELSSFSYWDYDLFATVSGAPLHTTKTENADLRLEYYPSPGEVISVSGFYKNFHNPIELMYIPSSGGGGVSYYYRNLQSALDRGLEVDLRKSLNFINSASDFLSNLYISGNFTWLNANISFYPNDAVDSLGKPVYPKRDRPLAGQSPYIINGGLLYTGKSFGVNLSYNRFGKRIVFASPDRGEDEYENPRNLLDLQVSYKFLKQKRAELKLNVNDLLNQEQLFYKNQFDEGNPLGFPARSTSVERYPGEGEALQPGQKDPKGTSYNKDYDMVVRRYKFGTTYSVNFIYRF